MCDVTERKERKEEATVLNSPKMSHTKPEGRLLCGDIEAPVALLSVESNVYVI